MKSISKSEAEAETETEEQVQKKVEPVEWLQDHIYSLHEKYLLLEYEVKISWNERLWMQVNVSECRWIYMNVGEMEGEIEVHE
jgi:hypothetical protein